MKKRIAKVLSALAVVILLTAPASPVLAAEWFVDDEAAPGGDGSDWDNAFQTLADAFTAWAPGDTINVDKVSNEAPWVGTDIISGMLLNMPAGEQTLIIIDAADGSIKITKQGAGTAVCGFIVLTDNPGTYDPPGYEEPYFDIYLSTDTNIDSLAFVIDFPDDFAVAFFEETGNRIEDITLYYWTGTVWRAWSNQSFVGTVFTGTITDDTVPTLAQLSGTPIALGYEVTTSIPNRLISWIPLIFGLTCVIAMLLMVTVGKVHNPTVLIISGILAVIGIIVLVALT